ACLLGGLDVLAAAVSQIGFGNHGPENSVIVDRSVFEQVFDDQVAERLLAFPGVGELNASFGGLGRDAGGRAELLTGEFAEEVAEGVVEVAEPAGSDFAGLGGSVLCTFFGGE